MHKFQCIKPEFQKQIRYKLTPTNNFKVRAFVELNPAYAFSLTNAWDLSVDCFQNGHR